MLTALELAVNQGSRREVPAVKFLIIFGYLF